MFEPATSSSRLGVCLLLTSVKGSSLLLPEVRRLKLFLAAVTLIRFFTLADQAARKRFCSFSSSSSSSSSQPPLSRPNKRLAFAFGKVSLTGPGAGSCTPTVPTAVPEAEKLR